MLADRKPFPRKRGFTEGLFKDSISFFPMDAPQGSADLAILPEDVASSLSCGNLALWRDKDYVLTCSDRDIDTDLFCPGDLTSPLHPGFPLLGNYF